VARRAHGERVHEDPLSEVGVIIVRLWWEQAGASHVAMRARVTTTTTANDGPAGSSSAASTIDGIVDAVRAAVDRFLARRPGAMGGARG
jgi:hypothetical protein